jgi:hypothetical protein
MNVPYSIYFGAFYLHSDLHLRNWGVPLNMLVNLDDVACLPLASMLARPYWEEKFIANLGLA